MRKEPRMDLADAPSLGRNGARLTADELADDDGVVPPPAAQVAREAGQAESPVRPIAESSGDIDELLVEIFSRTGMRVDRNDPLVAAALIQSNLMRRAATDASRTMQQAVIKCTAELAEAARIEREGSASLERTVHTAFERVSEAAKQVGDRELENLRARFTRTAEDALAQIRSAASLNVMTVRWRMAASLLLGLALGSGCAVWWVGLKLGARSPEEIRLMNNGQVLDSAWSKLPASTKKLMQGAQAPAGAPEDAP